MDWTGDKNSVFMTLGASNHTDKIREKDDFYATEPRAIDALVASPVGMSLPEKVWECACGTGTLSERLEYFGYNVVSSDLVNRGYGQTVDFLECRNMPQDCKCIITNPPYKYALEFVKHGIELLPEDGVCVMFLKTQFLEGQRRWKEIYSSTPPQVGTTVPGACSVCQKRAIRGDAQGRRQCCQLRMVRVGERLHGKNYDRLDRLV